MEALSCGGVGDILIQSDVKDNAGRYLKQEGMECKSKVGSDQFIVAAH